MCHGCQWSQNDLRIGTLWRGRTQFAKEITQGPVLQMSTSSSKSLLSLVETKIELVLMFEELALPGFSLLRQISIEVFLWNGLIIHKELLPERL